MTDDDTTSEWAPGGEMSRHREAATSLPRDPDDDDSDWWGDDPEVSVGAVRRGRRRMVTIMGMLTVVGFGAATVISSGESRGPATMTAPSAATESSVAVSDEAGEPTLLDAELPVVVGLGDVGLSGLPELEVVALSSDGTVHEIDFAAETVRSTTTPGIASTAPVYIFTRNGEISVIAADDVNGFVLDRDRRSRLLNGRASAGGMLFPGPFENSAWQLDNSESADVAAELVALDGGPLGPAVRREVHIVLGGDGLGQLVVVATGGAYVVGTGLPIRLTTGEVLAIGVAHVLARECDERFACRVVVRTRAGEGVVALTGALVELTQAESPGGIGELISGTVSPDGTVVFVRSDALRNRWAAVDLASGLVSELPSPAALSPVVWSADSRFAAFVAGDRLFVFDRDAGRATLIDAFPTVRSLVPARLPRLEVTSGPVDENGAVIENGIAVDLVLAVDS